MGKIIGIDLGTTNSAVAVIDSKEPKVITNEEGNRTTPSVVSYTKDGDRLVGDVAKRQSVMNPGGTIYSVKRFMGMKFSSSKEEVGKVAYDVIPGKDGSCKIKVGSDLFSPEEISAQTILKLKRTAEKYLGSPVTEAVITVPAYFNDSQRQATKDASKIAGLEVKRIINEPTAAALAYGLDKSDDQKVAVYDLGGGTFDISILDISDNVVEVLSTNGDTHLGGDDVDNSIMDWMVSSFKEETGIDLSSDKMVLQRLKEAAEKAKVELSSAQSTDITLPFLTADASGPRHLNLTLSRSKFEQMIESFVSKTMSPVKQALKDASLSAEDIDEVLLVGGSTRMPAVRDAVKSFFGKEPNSSVNPDEVVALGAAVQAGVFSGDVTDILLLDVTPLSLGIETLGGVMTTLISRNTTIPTSKSEVYSTADNNQSAVDINVLQGERKFALDNMTLGRFRLDGIPPAPRGVPQIEVTFDIDANGMVNVSALDKATDRKQSIVVTGTGALSDSDIEKMVNDAIDNEESDRLKLQIIENRNKLDTLVYQSGKLLDDNGDKLSEDTRGNIESNINNAKETLDSDDPAALEGAAKELELALHVAGQELYSEQTTSAEEGVDESYNDAPPNENVVDADYEEVAQ